MAVVIIAEYSHDLLNVFVLYKFAVAVCMMTNL